MARFLLATGTIITAVLSVLWLAVAADAHLIRRAPATAPAWQVERSQLANLAHARYVARRGGGRPRWWHRKAAGWLRREHRELQARTLGPWQATKACESPNLGWHGDGAFDGGLQFHPDTWRRLGGLRFAPFAFQATPIQQVTIAWRHGGDGWPSCPNP